MTNKSEQASNETEPTQVEKKQPTAAEMRAASAEEAAADVLAGVLEEDDAAEEAEAQENKVELSEEALENLDGFTPGFESRVEDIREHIQHEKEMQANAASQEELSQSVQTVERLGDLLRSISEANFDARKAVEQQADASLSAHDKKSAFLEQFAKEISKIETDDMWNKTELEELVKQAEKDAKQYSYESSGKGDADREQERQDLDEYESKTLLETESGPETLESKEVPLLKDIQILDVSSTKGMIQGKLAEKGVGVDGGLETASNLDSVLEKIHQMIEGGQKIDVIMLGGEMSANSSDEESGWKSVSASEAFLKKFYDLRDDLLEEQSAGDGSKFDLIKDAKIVVVEEYGTDAYDDLKEVSHDNMYDSENPVVGKIAAGDAESVAEKLKQLLLDAGVAKEADEQ